MLTISNMIVASALIVLVWLVGCIPFLRRRPAIMHLLWLIALAKCVTPAFVTIPILPAEPAISASVPVNLKTPPPPLVMSPASLEKADLNTPVVKETPVSINWRAIALAVWMAGILLIVSRAVYQIIRLQRLLQGAIPSERLSQLLGNCGGRMQVARLPEVLSVDLRCSPFLLARPGRSCIYVPQAMVNELSDGELESVLGHELAHHWRGDVLANLFAFAVAAVCWWNPLVWLARRQLRAAQELCCDALVISRNAISRRDYAGILLATLDQVMTRQFRSPGYLAAGWGEVSSLKARFRMIGDQNVMGRLPRNWLAASAILCVALLCVPGRAQAPKQQPLATAPDAKVQIRKARVFDGQTNQPLANIRVRINAEIRTTDADGMVDVPVVQDKPVLISLSSPGWWSGQWNRVRVVEEAGQPEARPADKAIQIKAWHGTIVTGRLLAPDTKPIAGARLIVSTYITSQEWKKRLGMDLSFNSWDHGDWPNWSCTADTGADGRFEATIPPDDAREWIRVSTGEPGATYAINRDAKDPFRAIAAYAPFEKQVAQNAVDGKVELYDLQLARGTVLRGRVVDAGGKPLAGVRLYTSGLHGPYGGRYAFSGADGAYEFLPMHPGALTLSPYAQLTDEKGETISRDVRAVFVPQVINLPETDKPVDVTIRAMPYVMLEFEWIDRRSKKTVNGKPAPVSYYGTFSLAGKVTRDDGSTAMWRGETELTTRGGKQILFVKVPRRLKTPALMLTADSLTTASYSDGRQNAGPGSIELQDITEARHRIIYGDDPRSDKH